MKSSNTLLGTSRSEPPSNGPSSPERTFVVRGGGAVWHLADDQGLVGGLFSTLEAALTFVRRDCASRASARVIVVDERCAARAA